MYQQKDKHWSQQNKVGEGRANTGTTYV